MPGFIYPKEKEKLLQMLSPDEVKMIKKDYPFKQVRNAKIYELMQKGVSCTVLAELPGMFSKSSIHRIGQTGGNIKYLNDNEQSLKNDLIKIQAALNTFNKEINKILKYRRK